MYEYYLVILLVSHFSVKVLFLTFYDGWIPHKITGFDVYPIW